MLNTEAFYLRVINNFSEVYNWRSHHGNIFKQLTIGVHSFEKIPQEIKTQRLIHSFLSFRDRMHNSWKGCINDKAEEMKSLLEH